MRSTLLPIKRSGGVAVERKPVISMQAIPYRGIARLILVVGLLAFALPFATVSCGGQHVLTGTGLNTITGANYSTSGHVQAYSGQVSFTLALLGGVVALAILFAPIRLRVQAIAAGLASLWTAAILFVGQAP